MATKKVARRGTKAGANQGWLSAAEREARERRVLRQIGRVEAYSQMAEHLERAKKELVASLPKKLRDLKPNQFSALKAYDSIEAVRRGLRILGARGGAA